MQDYFADTDTEETPQQANTTETSESDDTQTALIPRTALQGKDCKVGDRLTFEVTGVDEDAVEAKLAEAERENESPEEQRSEMDSMMSDEGEGQGY